jgi:photosystem II stability/assembly factor-like uncharacterized protein
VNKLLPKLTILFLLGFFFTTHAQKGSTPTKTGSTAHNNSANCPLVVAIQDNTPSAVCSELLKTLVAVSSACTDTTAVSYQWSSSIGGVFSTLRTTTFNLPEFLVATPVTFTVVATEGSETVSASYTITVKPRPSRPSLSPFGTIILCDNLPITLTSSACTGGSTPTWSNGVTGTTSISVPAVGGTFFKVACERNGCVSDSTAAAALITGTVTQAPTTTSRTICEGTPITAGNGLQAQLVNCPTGTSGTYTYTGPTVGYDQGYRNTGGVDPSVVVPNTTNTVRKVSISITWRKQKGGFQNSCGVGDTESWPYHNETQFRVMSPSGKIITLVNTNSYGGENNPTVTTVFEDGANPINYYSPPVSGTFAPAQPLSAFIGENPSGTWTLLPYDAVWKDPLCVSGFSVTFTASQLGTLTWWDAPTGGNQVGTGSEFIPTVTAAGTYTYYAQGQCAGGCPSVRTATTLTINATPPAPVIDVNIPLVGNTRSICNGESINLTATGCNNGGTVKWSGNIQGANFATGASYTFVPSGNSGFNTNHTFTAICEGTNLCRSVTSNTISLTVKYKPAIPTISGPGSTACINSNVTLTASGCSGGTVGWTGNRTGNPLNFIISNNVSIKAACTINGCTSDSTTAYAISTLPKPATPNINASQVQAICIGGSVTLSSNCANGTTTKWTGGLTGSPVTITPTITRSYRASCLGTNGCASDSSVALNIVVLPKTKPTIAGTTFVCGPSSVTLTANGCSGASETVMWRDESTGNTYTQNITQTRTFRAVCIRNGYCVSDSSDIFTVQYRNKPSQPSITVPTNTTVCQGSSVMLTASACGGGTLVWTGGLIGSSITISALGTRAYKVACTINNCTSDSSLAVSVTVNPKPSQPTISSSGSTTVCQGINVVLNASACSSGTLGWTGGLTGSSIIISSVGIRAYKVACTINGCTSDSSAATTVQIKAVPLQPTITSAPLNTTICQGSSVLLTASACSGGTLGWTGGLTGSSITISTLGTRAYKVACTINNCTSDSSSAVSVTVLPAPIFTVSANKTSLCGGESATITATGCIGTLSWTGGATTSSITVSPMVTTTYTATCTVNNCSSTQQVTITPLQTPSVTASGILQCNGTPVTLTATNVPSGSSIQWRKDGVDIAGATGATYSTSVVGVYDFVSYTLNNSGMVSNSNPNKVVYFIDKNIGFAINDGIISKTIDGGVTWIVKYSVNSGPIIPLNNITFINPTTGWAVGQNGIYLKTTNGGDTWNYTSINTNFPLMKIKFRDSNNGTIVGDFGAIFTTSNGGNTWTPVNTFTGGNYPTFTSLSFVPNTTNVWAVGSKYPNGFVAKSTDNGATWTETTLGISSIPANTYFNNITFTSANDGFIVGDNGTIFKTTNGGTNWQLQTSPISSSLKDIQFVNNQTGFICGTFPNGSLLKTTNGGSTWKALSIGFYPVSLSFVDENTGWLTNYGNIMKYTAPQCPTTPAVLTAPQAPTAPTITPPTNSTICQGNSIMLSATGCTGTYTWTGGLTGSSVNVSPTVTTNYTVTCTTGNCTSANSSAVSITVNPKPLPPVINQTNPSICGGQNTTLSVIPIGGGTYTWTGGLTGTSINVSPATTRTYKVAVSVNGCVSDSASVTVNVTNVNAPTITLGGEACTNNLPLKIWDNTIANSGDDNVRSIINTPDGGKFLLMDGLYGGNPRMRKTDANGTMQWTRALSIPSGYSDMNVAVATNDGGYLIGGYNNSSSIGGDVSSTCRLGLGNLTTMDFWILKVDANGVRQWDKRFGGNKDDNLNDLIKTSDGGYLLGGFTSSDQGGDVSEPGYVGIRQYWTVKIDANGLKQWDKRLATEQFSTDFCSINSLLQTSDGGYLLGGNGKKPFDINNLSVPRTDDFFIVKVNNSGIKQWQDFYDNNAGAEYLKSMQPTSDGGYLLIGNTDAGNGNIWTVKINATGIKQWDKQFGGTGNDQATVIKAIPNENNFLIGGRSSSGINGDKSEVSKGGFDMWLLKIRADGTKIWDKTIGGNRTDYINSLAVDNDGSIIIAGASNSSISGDKTTNAISYNDPLSGTLFYEDSWFVKLNSNCPPQTSATILLGDSLILKASNCSGTVNWSDGKTGSVVTIKPTINTSYTATCAYLTCQSSASTPFSITVDTRMCESLKSGSWTDPTTWSCNRVPTATDDVFINAGHTVTENSNPIIRAKTLTYRGGMLLIPQTTTLRLGNQ